MLKVAYLANQFPSSVEPYVKEEIDALRQRGTEVVAGSIRKPDTLERVRTDAEHELGMIVVFPLDLRTAWRATRLLLKRWDCVQRLLRRVLREGKEPAWQRAKTLVHTWLGGYYAVLLEEHAIEHIHVHHGYFGSWVGMVAAQLLDVSYSLTLHGSDLLVRRSYLDTKLRYCAFCFTISDYNRNYIAQHYPEIDIARVAVKRLGVDFPASCNGLPQQQLPPLAGERFSLLAVGRLQAVKNHSFLLRACAQLQAGGLDFDCVIAGEGPERRHLEKLIVKYRLEGRVTLVGHVARHQMDSLYARADLVVLTSRSEGIPLVLMEAMVRGKVVLAPAITGIPELILPGKTGFLYEPGSPGDFCGQVLLIHSLAQGNQHPNNSAILSAARPLDWIKHGARAVVNHNFNRRTNLNSFVDQFIQQTESLHANPVLQ